MSPNTLLALAAALTVAAAGPAQSAAQQRSGSPARTLAPPAAISEIRRADLERDLELLAGDGLRGREAGTVDEMRASIWIADRMRMIGLEPVGDFGSFLQWWNMRRTRLSTVSSSIVLEGRPIELWTGITPATNAAVDVTGVTVFVRNVQDTTIDVQGKVAVAGIVAPPVQSIRSTTNTWAYNYTRPALTQLGATLSRHGAAAVVIVADSVADLAFDGVARVQSRGTYDVIGGVPRFSRNPPPRTAATAAAPPARPVPILLVRSTALDSWQRDGQQVDIRLRSESFEYPSTNIVGVVRGTDPALRDEFVLFSSHQDHDGIRYTVDGDSIWNGADDNGTTSVALLAIARAWKRQPSRRSALFVFHGAEERGLLGSRYHVANPVVPLERIAAVLNGDMIGRNHPDTAALLGSQPPHRNSVELVQMAIDANTATSRFVIDSLWDRPSHPEGWYFRSDHVPYAERRIPSLFFSSNLHGDYHTPRDEPRTIDYEKLTRIARWMYMTGWLAANSDRRPAVDAGFILR
ncbi:MAG: M28 family metallopeptidase [Gemmatimonadota bacterium]